jgi:hypothetical protein
MLKGEHLQKGAIAVLGGAVIPSLAAYYFGVGAFWISFVVCLIIIITFSEATKAKTDKFSKRLESLGRKRPVISSMIVFMLSGSVVTAIWLYGLYRPLPSPEPPPEPPITKSQKGAWQAKPPQDIFTSLVVDSIAKNSAAFHYEIKNGQLAIAELAVSASSTHGMSGEASSVRSVPPYGEISVTPPPLLDLKLDGYNRIVVSLRYVAHVEGFDKTFISEYRFFIAPTSIKEGAVLRPEGFETREATNQDMKRDEEDLLSRFRSSSASMFLFYETTKPDGQPNIVTLANERKTLVLDPISKMATFTVKLDSGKEMHLSIPITQKRHRIGAIWDHSKGALLIVDDVKKGNLKIKN